MPSKVCENPLPADTTKVCPKCHREKKRQDFGRWKYGEDGWRVVCKACEKKRRRQGDYKRRKARENIRTKRPEGVKSADLHCRISEDVKRGMKYIADANGLTLSAQVDVVLRQYVVNYIADATRKTNAKQKRMTG